MISWGDTRLRGNTCVSLSISALIYISFAILYLDKICSIGSSSSRDYSTVTILSMTSNSLMSSLSRLILLIEIVRVCPDLGSIIRSCRLYITFSLI